MSHKMYLESIRNARDALLKADVYCDIIQELFIYLGCTPGSKDSLNYILEEDIRMFISRQNSKLDNLLNSEESYNVTKN